MEISPISGIRALPVVKVPPADSDLSRVLGAEDSARPGDDSYSGNGKKPRAGRTTRRTSWKSGVEAESSEHSQKTARARRSTSLLEIGRSGGPRRVFFRGAQAPPTAFA